MVWVCITVWVNHDDNSSGPSIWSLKSLMASIWFCMSKGGISNSAAICSFLNEMVTSGLAWMPARDVILPSLKVNQRPMVLSAVRICTVMFFSLRRVANAGWRRAVNFSTCDRPNKITENFENMIASFVRVLRGGEGLAACRAVPLSMTVWHPGRPGPHTTSRNT